MATDALSSLGEMYLVSLRSRSAAEATVAASNFMGTPDTAKALWSKLASVVAPKSPLRAVYRQIRMAAQSCNPGDATNAAIIDEGKQHAAAAVAVQRLWRGRGYRLKVLKKWLSHASNGLDAWEEQHLRISVIVDNLWPPTAHARVNSVSASLGAAASLPPVDLPPGPLTELGAAEIVSAFCCERLLSLQLVTQLLERQIVLQATMPNVVEYMVPEGAKLRVVGDLHGQFADLMQVFQDQGLPCAERPYLFNGDFVDRGPCGAECILTLFAFQQACPKHVHLSGQPRTFSQFSHGLRGPGQVRSGGVCLFLQAFAGLPLAYVVNKQVLVLHGGVDDDLSLDALRKAPRREYRVVSEMMALLDQPPPHSPSSVMNAAPLKKKGLVPPNKRGNVEANRELAAKLKPIVSTLWNDPHKSKGTAANSQRSQWYFGADVVQRFLEREHLALIIRSHEMVRPADLPCSGAPPPAHTPMGGCCERCASMRAALASAATTRLPCMCSRCSKAYIPRSCLFSLLAHPWVVQVPMGYEWPFDNERSVLTIFSASNYSGKSNNKGAVALLGPPLKSGSTKLKAVDKSRFTASYGDLTLIQHEAVPLSALVLEQRTIDCLWRLVISRRELLRQAYRAADVFGLESSWSSGQADSRARSGVSVLLTA